MCWSSPFPLRCIFTRLWVLFSILYLVPLPPLDVWYLYYRSTFCPLKFDVELSDLLTFIYPAGWVRLSLLILWLCIQQRQQVQYFIFPTKISQDLFLLTGKPDVHTLAVLRGWMLMMVPPAPPAGWQLLVNCWMNRRDILAYIYVCRWEKARAVVSWILLQTPPSGSTCQFRFDSPTSCSAERRGGLTSLHVQLINTSAPSPSTLTGVPSLRRSASFFFFFFFFFF